MLTARANTGFSLPRQLRLCTSVPLNPCSKPALLGLCAPTASRCCPEARGHALTKLPLQVFPEQTSLLCSCTSCIACYPDGRGYALGSVEGRVAMELYDLAPEVQAGKYAFKVGASGLI